MRSTYREHFPVLSSFVTRLTRRVSLVEQELPIHPEHLSSSPVFSGVRVTRSLVLYVCFVDRCLSFCTFSFIHCVCSFSIYGLWLPLWYLQTLLVLLTIVLYVRLPLTTYDCRPCLWYLQTFLWSGLRVI